MDNEKLEKGWKGALAGLALATAPYAAAAKDNPSVPASEVSKTPQTPQGPQFDTQTLHPDMHAIAMLESSYGKNMEHAKNTDGEFETAYGPIGFKPSTAYDEFSKSKHLMELYPELKDKTAFHNAFKSDPKFYNLVAGTHWNRLKKATGSATGAAYAWRWGIGAYKSADANKVKNDEYVKKYSLLSEKQPWKQKPKLAKSEDLEKAISQLKPGNQVSHNEWDYSHLLHPTARAKGYSVKLTHETDPTLDFSMYKVHALHNGQPVGTLNAFLDPQNRSIEPHIDVDESHRGQGLGSALYEATMRHGLSNNFNTLASGAHSPAAVATKTKLAAKHGLVYKPRIDPHDNWAEPASIMIKAGTIEAMSLGNIPVGGLERKDKESNTYNYDHVLTPEHISKGLSLKIQDFPSKVNPNVVKQEASLFYRGRKVGWLESNIDKGTKSLNIENSSIIKNSLQGQKLGKAMYESIMAHAKNAHGVQTARGKIHSSLAHYVHMSLANKYNMKYRAEPNVGDFFYPTMAHWRNTPDHEHDGKYGAYSYILKYAESGELSKSVKEDDTEYLKPMTEKAANSVNHNLLDPSPHKDNQEHFAANVINQPHPVEPIYKRPFYEDLEAYNADTNPNKVPGVNRKLIYDVGGKKYLVKPFHGENLEGWAEHASQDIYHAAGLGHLTQKSHISEIPHSDGSRVASTVIEMNPNAEPFLRYSYPEDYPAELGDNRMFKQQALWTDDLDDTARKMAILDFLTGNYDRNSENLMVLHPKGSTLPNNLFSIDHGGAFDYPERPEKSPERLYKYIHGSPLSEIIMPEDNHVNENDRWHNPLKWWSKSRNNIEKAFFKNLNAVTDVNQRNHLYNNFQKRADHLDKLYKLLRDGRANDHITDLVMP